MAKDIITQYTGPFQKPRESTSGDAEHIRLILVDDDGARTVLFTGEDFDESQFSDEPDD
ncbi:hypothetical protein ACFL24_02810 [Patescibacteria group bacterium]